MVSASRCSFARLGGRMYELWQLETKKGPTASTGIKALVKTIGTVRVTRAAAIAASSSPRRSGRFGMAPAGFHRFHRLSRSIVGAMGACHGDRHGSPARCTACSTGARACGRPPPFALPVTQPLRPGDQRLGAGHAPRRLAPRGGRCDACTISRRQCASSGRSTSWSATRRRIRTSGRWRAPRTDAAATYRRAG
jgi:hypothetical protein